MKRAAELHADQGGQISALGVLGAAAFACLLMLVINTGYATSGKIQMQNSADAAAISGATWVARGLNIVSLNNVTQTQLLAIAMIIPALDRAMVLAKATLELQKAACSLLLVGAGVCIAIIQGQILYLDALHAIVQAAAPLGGQGGLLWQAMQILHGISGVISGYVGGVGVASSFVAAAEAETYRVARQNGAEIGVLIPARYRLTLPVHEGSFRGDLCPPTRNGRAGPGALGVTGYEDNQGPLENFAGKIGVLFYLIENSLIRVYFRATRAAEYQMLCGGAPVSISSAEEVDRERVRSRAECLARGGGTAYWNVQTHDSGSYPSRQSSPAFPPPPPIETDEARRAEAERNRPIDHTCVWEPPGRRVGPDRYQYIEERVEVVGQDADGRPVRRYSYRMYEYVFLSATLTSEEGALPEDSPMAAAAPDPGYPNPYLLGATAGARTEDIRRELRYLAVVYRTQPVIAAPLYFRSALGEHRLAYGQARVYNPTAFDTFTQDWRVTLDAASMVEDGTLLGGFGTPGLMRLVSSNAAAPGFNTGSGLFSQLNLLRHFNNH